MSEMRLGHRQEWTWAGLAALAAVPLAILLGAASAVLRYLVSPVYWGFAAAWMASSWLFGTWSGFWSELLWSTGSFMVLNVVVMGAFTFLAGRRASGGD